ncbi:MAG: nucleoside:proton symporter [Rhodospirillaceae bacterium]|jgi:concentrative nucleoside transporter, CNT family|nr:nucleoside:proton symporter [Rhodospirillaceae bacterium]
MEALQSGVGLLGLTAIAWLVGRQAPRLALRTAASGLLIQLALGAVLLKLPGMRSVFAALNDIVLALQRATQAGTSFVFGYVGGGDAPFTVTKPASSFILAFQALPLILLVSALSALLFYWRILPLVVRGFAWVLQRTMGLGGAVGVATAANVFIGMIDAPLLIRPYLAKLSRGELFIVMVVGMATVAGTVMVLYASILAPVIPEAMGHILAASLISAPAAVMVARLMVPDDSPPTPGDLAPDPEVRSSMQAIANGTMQGITLLAAVIAMLIVFVALVALVNEMLGLLPWGGEGGLRLEELAAYVMWPLAWLCGVPAGEAMAFARLLAVKTVINELAAYVDLAGSGGEALSERSRMIATYALCGFANFGSLGIVIAGLGAMAPERRGEIVSLGFLCLVGGTLATCMTGAVVGLLGI